MAGLLYSATLWGLMWWPFRELAAQGMPVALAQLVNYGVAVLLGVPLLFGVLRRPWQWQWEIILIGLAGGLANIGFLTAVIHGSVMRITLLFYLSPLWTLLLSWWLLHERPNRYGLGVFALACTGGA